MKLYFLIFAIIFVSLPVHNYAHWWMHQSAPESGKASGYGHPHESPEYTAQEPGYGYTNEDPGYVADAPGYMNEGQDYMGDASGYMAEAPDFMSDTSSGMGETPESLESMGETPESLESMGETPKSKTKSPPSKDEKSKPKSKTPPPKDESHKSKKPAAKHQASKSKAKTPVSNDEAPSSNDEAPSSMGQTPDSSAESSSFKVPDTQNIPTPTKDINVDPSTLKNNATILNISKKLCMGCTEESLQFVFLQNLVRARKGLQPLMWDQRLERYAKNWAAQRKAKCELQHSMTDGNFQIGENIFWGGGNSWTPQNAVTDWAAEEKYYDINSNTCAKGQMCGHYTQIVWKTTRRVGCARIICDTGDTFMTCNYSPPGNYVGEKPY